MSEKRTKRQRREREEGRASAAPVAADDHESSDHEIRSSFERSNLYEPPLDENNPAGMATENWRPPDPP
jgi:hypothetical protein